MSIEEMRTEDMEALVADKPAAALRGPHGLYLELLNGFPAGLTEIFWERCRRAAISMRTARSTAI